MNPNRYEIFRADNGKVLKTVKSQDNAALTAKRLANALNIRVGICQDEGRAVYFSPSKEQTPCN